MIKISIFFCQGCQQNCDSDLIEVHEGEDGLYCDDCFTEKTEESEIEKIAKQCDCNSLEIMDIDSRVKNLEGGKK